MVSFSLSMLIPPRSTAHLDYGSYQVLVND